MYNIFCHKRLKCVIQKIIRILKNNNYQKYKCLHLKQSKKQYNYFMYTEVLGYVRNYS